jgi:hypothetical protein
MKISELGNMVQDSIYSGKYPLEDISHKSYCLSTIAVSDLISCYNKQDNARNIEFFLK